MSAPRLFSVRFPLPDADLAVALVDFDSQALDLRGNTAQGFVEPLADVCGHQFGRCIGDWQQPAVAARKNPATILKSGRHLAAVILDADLRMLRGEQHVV